MWNRRRTWLVLAALSCVALAVYFEPTHCVRGWLQGEAFFDGRPTSYWRSVIERDLQIDPRVLLGQVPPPPPSWWERCKSWVGYRATPDSSLRLLHHQDHARLSVLKEITQDPNEKIARFAAGALRYRGRWVQPSSAWFELILTCNLRKQN